MMGETLRDFERIMLARVSDAHVAYIARRAGQITAMQRLEAAGLVRKVADLLHLRQNRARLTHRDAVCRQLTHSIVQSI